MGVSHGKECECVRRVVEGWGGRMNGEGELEVGQPSLVEGGKRECVWRSLW